MTSSKSASRFPRYFYAFGFLFMFFPGGGILLWSVTPNVAWLKAANPRETTLMHFQEEQKLLNGTPVQRIWKWVPLSQISSHLIQSVVASEDREFFKHKGFDWEYILAALKYDIKSRQIARGGSGITQQTAKNLFLGPSRTLTRKIREAFITYRLERELTKERILEIYLNIIEWGPGVYGAEAAAQTYFGKSAAELSLSESIRLVSIMPNPCKYKPKDNENENLRKNRKIILLYLLQQGWISKATYVQTMEELFSLNDCCQSKVAGPALVPPPSLPPN